MIDVLNPRCRKGGRQNGHCAAFPERKSAIGDNHNDEEMLCFAGIPVVMENAVPELKTRGWHVTPRMTTTAWPPPSNASPAGVA
jgi:hydroxymethylpyrimidine pyrophosphatase-like HAD family hydrolase